MNIPHLELTEEPNKNNDYIIFRHSIKSKKITKKLTNKTSKKKHKKTRKYNKKNYYIF